MSMHIKIKTVGHLRLLSHQAYEIPALQLAICVTKPEVSNPP